MFFVAGFMSDAIILSGPCNFESCSINSTPICPEEPIINLFPMRIEDNKKESNNKFVFY